LCNFSCVVTNLCNISSITTNIIVLMYEIEFHEKHTGIFPWVVSMTTSVILIDGLDIQELVLNIIWKLKELKYYCTNCAWPIKNNKSETNATRICNDLFTWLACQSWEFNKEKINSDGPKHQAKKKESNNKRK
jgi:hypothetical protein